MATRLQLPGHHLVSFPLRSLLVFPPRQLTNRVTEHFTNPLDSALLHLAALLLPDVRHRRLFATSSPYNINGIVAALRRLYPDRVLPGDVSDHGVDLSLFRERRDAEALLQRMGQSQGFVGLEESLRECCQGWV